MSLSEWQTCFLPRSLPSLAGVCERQAPLQGLLTGFPPPVVSPQHTAKDSPFDQMFDRLLWALYAGGSTPRPSSVLRSPVSAVTSARWGAAPTLETHGAPHPPPSSTKSRAALRKSPVGQVGRMPTSGA